MWRVSMWLRFAEGVQHSTSVSMDWIDPRFADEIKAESEDAAGSTSKSGKSRRKTLVSRTRAALNQSIDVWSAAYDHALCRISWPKHISAESTFLWSCVLQEQAEILVRAGMSANQISGLAQNSPSHLGEAGDGSASERRTTDQASANREAVSGLMSWPIETMATKWLDEADREADSAFGLIAFAWQLPEHAKRTGNTWLGPWLQDAADRVAKAKCDSDDSVLCELVLKCELPLLLGTVTGAGKRNLFSEAFDAMDTLALLLEQAEDQPARWLAYGSSYLRASLGSVLRCRMLADALGLRKFYAPQRAALTTLLEHASRWARMGGSSLLGMPGLIPVVEAHWEALAKLAKKTKSLTSVMTLADLTTRELNRKDAKKQVVASQLPPVTYYCDTARSALMQTDWHKRSGRMAIDFSDSPLSLEIVGPKGITLLAGRWPLQVELDGQAQIQLDDWDEVCWYSDDEVDYLEVEAKFGDECIVQRQMMLFHEDHMVMLADALLGDREGKWSMQSSLPLGAGIRYEEAAATRESWLVTPTGSRCLVMPLAQPEWRKQLCNMKTYVENESLVMRAATSASRLYSPVLISLKPGHAEKPLTWRQLTVAEDLTIVPPSVAVAYRVQIAKEQWLIYRTLAEATRRTALGTHTVYDFFAGRFDGDTGDVDILVEVEST